MGKEKKIIIIVLIFFIFLIINFILISFFHFKNKYRERVIPNVYFYEKSMAGLNYDEVELDVSQKMFTMSDNIVLKYLDKEVRTKKSDLGFSWDKEKTVNSIYNLGKSNEILLDFFNLASSLFNKKNVSLKYKIDEIKIKNYLKELATIVDQNPLDGKFNVVNNKVVDFSIGKNGQQLSLEKNIKLIEEALISQSQEAILEVEIIEAKGVEDMNKMGVKELIATGESNFSGSPPNRIHNINIGSQVFNGILIKPGENFSFISYLGEVSAKTGYLPELVIKEDKTIPEYGGGLCQVSTTFFRAAINAGFPIIERSSHAYRVVYYEPAGFDSTIYDPKPDLIFNNDTKNYVLIQTRISGNSLYVDFYGTNDGRVVEVGRPVIYNYVQPGEPIMIETTDLAPGEKKQTDTAHVGADAYFIRNIVYKNGETKEERFDSHYISWRAKFIIGKEGNTNNEDGAAGTPPYTIPGS